MKKQERIELMQSLREYICEYESIHGFAPTCKIIEAELGIPHSSAQRYMTKMEQEGVLRFRSGGGYSVTPESRVYPETVPVRLVGDIACGLPKYAEENVVETFYLPTSIFGMNVSCAFRAKGDSMIGKGINDGDLVFVQSCDTAEKGDTVVALIDGEEATLKTYVPLADGRVKLQPENCFFDPIIIDPKETRFEIQGVVKFVLKEA